METVWTWLMPLWISCKIVAAHLVSCLPALKTTTGYKSLETLSHSVPIPEAPRYKLIAFTVSDIKCSDIKYSMFHL